MVNWPSLGTCSVKRFLNRLSTRSVSYFGRSILNQATYDPWIPWRCLTIQAIDLIEEQAKRVDQRIDALLLVGGFSGSEYLFRRVKVRVNWKAIVWVQS